MSSSRSGLQVSQYFSEPMSTELNATTDMFFGSYPCSMFRPVPDSGGALNRCPPDLGKSRWNTQWPLPGSLAMPWRLCVLLHGPVSVTIEANERTVVLKKQMNGNEISSNRQAVDTDARMEGTTRNRTYKYEQYQPSRNRLHHSPRETPSTTFFTIPSSP